MKLWALLPVALGLGALMHAPAKEEAYVLILTGDSRGSLGPCGCTKPMTGGLKRLATAFKAFQAPGKTVLLVNGDLSGGFNRQEELKAQTLAETLVSLEPVAVRLGEADERSPQAAASIRSILGDRVLAAGGTVDTGGFRVIADSQDRLRLAKEAASGGFKPVLLIEGGLKEAQMYAREVPEIALVQYRTDSRAEWSREGQTLLVSPGSKLRDLIVLSSNDGVIADPKIVALDEHIADDPDVSRIYKSYLGRVDKENLIAQVERSGSERFAGSKTCAMCHGNEGKVWEHSKHAIALKSLEGEGHGRDPECVPCHVVGLDRLNGFKDRVRSNSLANVGCESCHGAGAQHARTPRKFSLPAVEEKKCVSCHTADQSPGFKFESFWKQIQH